MKTAKPSLTPVRTVGSELREWLRPKLVRAENAILDVLVAARGEPLSNAQIADSSGYTVGSGGFNNALGKLRTIEAAVGYERSGGTRVHETLLD